MGNRKPHQSQSQKNPTPTPAPTKVRGWTPDLTDPNYPPYDERNKGNVGRIAAYGGHDGTWAGAREGDVAGLVGRNDQMSSNNFNNVEGNPKWPNPANPPYRWNGSRWVR